MSKSVAILFGINYKGFGFDNGELRGCVNDVRNFAKFLKETAGYDRIETYTDEDDPRSVSRQAIMDRLMRLRDESKELNRIWIHYSGHGCGIPDAGRRDEADGKDECILPVDYRTHGVITDDHINRMLHSIHPNAKVVMVFDCCHSGTIADLRYNYASNTRVIENRFSVPLKTDVCVISGCTDAQTSADAYNVRGMRAFSGAMSSCLLEVLASERGALKCLVALRKKLEEKGFEQTAQMSSTCEIDFNSTLY